MTGPHNASAPLAHKIRPRHFDRLAIVYVRQSTAQQVVGNRESADLQYQLRRRAIEYGWAESRVVVIDDDQGMSGQSIEGRLGFQRLLAEVSLGHVGIVFGREMSRLARSCKDWHQLLDLCAIFQVLLADADGVYDPTDPNDRMLLGLRGMMSEAELHVLRSRLLQGKRNKARRGEAFGFVPIGYVRTPGGGVELDPDEQARAAVRLVFEKVAELGSARRAHAFLVTHDIQLGVRSFAGPDKGRLTWRRPRLSTLYDMLRHPFYAGAYVYGRCVVDPTRRSGGKSRRRSARPDEWISLIRDKVPAYITWEQYEENRRRMAANDKGRSPSAKGDRAETLLNRLARCGRCGGPMVACNTREAREPRYACDPRQHEAGGTACQTLTAIPVDRLIGSLVLEAVRPAGLELSLRADEQARRDRDRVREAWRHKIERATYNADRARRQYDAAEPENRLVARELERRWEEALASRRQVEEDYARFEADLAREMSAADRDRIRALAADLPALWSSPTTCGADRREVVRLLIERVELNRRGETDVIEVVVSWRGGAVSRHVIRQRVRGYAQLGRFADLRGRIVELRGSGQTSPQIAAALNAEGFPMPRGEAFTGDTVRRLCRQLGLTERPATPGDGEPRTGEWWLPALAAELGVARSVLYRWRQCGYITARRRAGTPTEWVVWADATEMRRLRKLRAFEEGHRCHKPPVELTTPRDPGPKTDSRGEGSSSARMGGK
jgi:DNA invertase Pin-like site-specific DNA recombinase